MEPLVLESCHSTWLFDTERMRFRRVLKGLEDSRRATTDWRPYYGLDLDPVSESFVVLLNEDGTRLLASRRALHAVWRRGDGRALSRRIAHGRQGLIRRSPRPDSLNVTAPPRGTCRKSSFL
jgi:hypothetical protein